VNPRTIATIAQSLAINAVSLYGVVAADWPIGTAIALYWSENVLRGLLLLALLLVSHLFVRKEGELAEPDDAGRFTVRKFLALSLGFNAAHALFLAVILGLVVPRMAPGERFETGPFRQGLVLIAILLALEIPVWVWTFVSLRPDAPIHCSSMCRMRSRPSSDTRKRSASCRPALYC